MNCSATFKYFSSNVSAVHANSRRWRFFYEIIVVQQKEKNLAKILSIADSSCRSPPTSIHFFPILFPCTRQHRALRVFSSFFVFFLFSHHLTPVGFTAAPRHWRVPVGFTGTNPPTRQPIPLPNRPRELCWLTRHHNFIEKEYRCNTNGSKKKFIDPSV